MYWWRCLNCTGIVNNKEIKNGAGCRHCGCVKIRRTNLTFREKIVELLRWPALLYTPRLWKNEDWMNRLQTPIGYEEKVKEIIRDE